MRALVIDDSRATRAIIGKILKEIGFEVHEAGNGREALDRLEAIDGFDLVMVDWNLPVMDGLEFVQRVRAQRVYDDVRLMMVTAETEREQVARALAAGANEYVMKPFSKDILVAKLNLLDVTPK